MEKTNNIRKIEFLRDYPHPWVIKFEVTDEIRKWWNGKGKII